MNYMMTAVLVLGVIALFSAVILYVCSKRFAVKEDPRTGEVSALLPQANCGGCGFPGCSGMAQALVKAADNGSIEGLECPVGGRTVMDKVASVLGLSVAESEPKIAVLRCQGSCDARKKTNIYDGLRTCAAMSLCGSGEMTCAYGCLGCGDCAAACSFGGITFNAATHLPEIDEDICVACGSCVKACPRNLIELRNRGTRQHRVYVACRNHEKGAAALKACSASCIGCGKCVKECPFGAITIDNNVAYIDYTKCRMCRKCVKACPRNAIKAVNFPMPKTETAAAGTEPEQVKTEA